MNQLIKFANNASVRLAKSLRIGEKKIYVTPGDTAYFPKIEKPGEFFILCLVNNTTGAFEIVKCINVESDAFIVERALENTTAKAFPEGSLVENRLTAGSIQNIFNFTKATKDEAGLVFVGDYDDLVNGNSDREPLVPSVDAVKQYVDDAKQYAVDNAFICGGIVAFSGSFINKNPVPYGKTQADTNWQLCDGTNGTPDLRNRFIMGAAAPANIGQRGGSNTMTGTTGPCTLTVEQIPSHTHDSAPMWKVRNEGLTAAEPWEDHHGPKQYAGGGKSHTHPLSASSDNRPAFYTLAYIMKIK